MKPLEMQEFISIIFTMREEHPLSMGYGIFRGICLDMGRNPTNENTYLIWLDMLIDCDRYKNIDKDCVSSFYKQIGFMPQQNTVGATPCGGCKNQYNNGGKIV